MKHDVAAVVIGRNEGDRLRLCLASLAGQVAQVIYVDSGSGDGSPEMAGQLGAEVIELDLSRPFTAARARNAGLSRIPENDAIRFVQFVDGDCEIRSDWISTARSFLEAHAQAGVVAGRRRERFPQATLWNQLIDEEWASAPGKVKACGGDAMMRLEALREANGFNPRLIAGEEPELCLRMRQNGWEIWRLDAEMTLHDADMTRFSQWWQRSRRAGYTYAEGVAMYGRSPERHNVARLRRTLLWGLLLPMLSLGGLLVTPWAMLLAMLWPLQVMRLNQQGMRWSSATFLMLAKFAEVQGVLTWAIRYLRREPATLIEYK